MTHDIQPEIANLIDQLRFPSTRKETLGSLVKFKGNHTAINAVNEYLACLDLCEYTAELLSNCGNYITIETALRNLDHPYCKVRAHNAFLLGELHYQSAAPKLISMLDDENQVVPYVIGALAAIKATQAVPAFIQKLNETNDIFRAKMFIIALGEIGSSEAVPTLLQTITREWDMDRSVHHIIGRTWRYDIIEALVKIGDIDQIIEALSHDELKIRKLAYQVLSKM